MTRTSTAARRRSPAVPPALHYAVHSTLLSIKNVSFVIFFVGMPVLLYLVFGALFSAGRNGVGYSAMVMVSMAAYGALGAAMSGGSQLAMERRSGWFRSLSVTGLSPRSFLWAKAAMIMALVLPSLVLVYLAGLVLGGVRLPVGVWVVSLLAMWLALVPMAALGIVIGLWVKAEAVGGVTTLTLLLIAMLGGLWFPVEMMPPLMQQLARALPSYWLAELGRWPILGGAFPWTAVVVLLAWSAVLTAIGALGYRRAAATSKR